MIAHKIVPISDAAEDAEGKGVTNEEAPVAEEATVARDDVADLRLRWERIQAGFVDDPKTAVAEADGLVKAVVERLISGCEARRAELEGRWAAIGDQEVSTEELRRALQGYRNFFNRLLNVQPPGAD